MSSGPVTDLKVQLDIESAKFRSELEKVTKSIDGVAGKLSKISDKVGGSAASVFKGIASWDLLSGALQRAGGFLADGVKSFAAHEQASLRLSGALTNLGYNAKALLGPLEAQQRILEHSTLTNRDQVAQIQQLLLQFGIAPKSIERTTKALLDYSAATGNDARSATQEFAKAIATGKNGVEGLGISYQSTGDSAKDLDIAVGQLEEKFGGSAQAAATGLMGALDQLTKSQDDLGKSFGGFIGQIEKKLGVIRHFADGLDEWRILLGGATPEEDQHHRQVKINDLLEERAKFEKIRDSQGDAVNSLGDRLADKWQERIDSLTERIRKLQHESADYLKKSGGVHSSNMDGATGITEGTSAAARAANRNQKKRTYVVGHATTVNLRSLDLGTMQTGAEALHALLKGEADRLAETLRTPLEVFNDQLKHLDELWNAGVLSAENYNRALAEAKQHYQDAAGDLDTVGSALSRLGQAGLGMTGRLGQVIKAGSGQLAGDVTTVATGTLSKLGASDATAAAAAGPIGALIGVLAEIIQDSDTFRSLLDLTAQAVKGLADGLGPIIQPVVRIAAALVPFGEGLGKMLAPLGMLTDVILRPLPPVFIVLGRLFEALTPLIQILIGAITPIVGLLELQIEGALFGFFYAVKFLGLGLLEFASFVGPFWNGIIATLQNAFKGLADFDIAGAKPFGFLNDWADSLNGAIINTDEVNKQKAELANLDWESAQAKTDEIAATKDVTAAANDAASALYNLPAGYKIKAAQYDAANALNGMNVPGFADGGVVSRATLAMVGEGGEKEVIAPESMLRQVIREESGRRGDLRIQLVIDGRQVHAAVRKYEQRAHFDLTGDVLVPGGA